MKSKWFNLKTNLSLITLALLIIGCRGTHEIHPNYTVPTSPEVSTGLVIASLTYSGEKRAGLNVLYTSEDEEIRDGVQFDNGELDWTRKGFFGNIDRDDFEGRLIVMELPVGRYKFHKFGASRSRYLDSFELPFRVSEGDAVYVGTLHVHHQRTGTKQFTYSIGHNYESRSRDLKLFEKKYPQLKTVKVRIGEYLHR